MKPSDELFNLIKSLSKAEKIHFKKFSKRHIIGKQNKYVRLFEAIAKQRQGYNEKEIIKFFEGDKFVNQIHVAKNYLMGLILRSLSDLYSEKETDFILNEQLNKIKILLDKNLTRTAEKLIRKSKKSAASNNNYDVLYKLYDVEATITARRYTYKSQEELEKLSLMKQQSLDQIVNTSKYRSVNLMLNLISARWTYSRDEKDVKAIRNMLNIPIIKDENNATGFPSKYELYGIKSRAYRFLLDDEKSLEYRKKVVELMEEYPKTIEKYPERYVARLHDFISFSMGTETGISKGYQIEEYLKKLKDNMKIVVNSNKNKLVKAASWQAYYQLHIGYHYSSLNRNGFYEVMNEVNHDIDIHKDNLRIRYLFDLYYYCIVAYFEFEDYEESSKWLSRFFNHKQAINYEELYHTMMIFSIILHFELGNYELAVSLINNTNRYYKKKAKLYESEKVLLQSLRKLLSANASVEFKNIFEQLKRNLTELSAKESEKRFLNSFDFKRWIDKKLRLLQK